MLVVDGGIAAVDGRDASMSIAQIHGRVESEDDAAEVKRGG